MEATLRRRLQNAEWLRRAETQRLLEVLDGGQARTRAVGGIVRDTLLDRVGERSDIDLATELVPDEVAARAAAAGIAVYPTGIEHGTLTLRLGELVAEVTTLREDIDTDGRRAVVQFGTDWVRDASRRDFTINALYADMDGGLFDPLGGLADCIAGRVRFIGEPAQRIAEDRLRVYRFFRFSASHGGEKFDPAGLAACRAAAGTLGRLSAERVGNELRRMLALSRIATTLRVMTDAGVLDISSNALGLLQAYERVARRPDVTARLALLATEAGADALQSRWRLANDEVGRAGIILAAAQLLREFRLHEAAYRYPAAIAEGVDVAAALEGWTEAGRAAVVDKLHSLAVSEFPVRGTDLIRLGWRPGPELGRELERLESLWIESGFSLDREALLGLLRR